jgi:F-type H+-transporting ATPase subunit b
MNPWIIAAQAVNFLIFCLIMHRLLYRPVRQMLEQRRQEMEQDRRAAEQARQEAQDLKEEAEERQRHLDEKREEILQQARDDAEEERRQRLDELDAEADKRLERYRRRLERERREAFEALAGELRGGLVALTRAVLGAEQADLTDRSLERLGTLLADCSEEERAQARDQLSDDATVNVRSAVELGDAQEKRLRKLVEEHLGVEDIELDVATDESLIAGVEITAGPLHVQAHWRQVLDEALERRATDASAEEDETDKGEADDDAGDDTADDTAAKVEA